MPPKANTITITITTTPKSRAKQTTASQNTSQKPKQLQKATLVIDPPEPPATHPGQGKAPGVRLLTQSKKKK
jgi:hypothetical protein